MSSYGGAAVVHGNTAYFSRGYSVYSYTPDKDEWTKLPPCEYYNFGLAVVNDKVTTIGGWSGSRATNALLCLEDQGTKWREVLPPMPTARLNPATVTTPTHLIVAGGCTALYRGPLSTVKILDTSTLKWSSASSSPEAMMYPYMTLCGEHLYLSEENKLFSCSVEKLLKSCRPAYIDSRVGRSVWTKLSNIPVQHSASLTTLRGQVLAIGGSDKLGGMPTGAIHRYNRSSDSWSVVGELPTPRSHPLVAVLPSNELIAVGGEDGKLESCDTTEIAGTN